MIKKEKFNVKIITYTFQEQNDLVYKVLKENPQGLLLGEILIITGIQARKTLHKILYRLRKKVFVRTIVAKNKLYYAKINAKKIMKLEKKYNGI